MQNRNSRLIISAALVISVVGLAVGCAAIRKESKETRVSLDQLSEPARATVKRVTAGGHVDKIDKEVEKGKVIYDVEATVGGKHVEYAIAETDGAILGTETEITFSQLPEPVRVAAEKYFGTSAGLKAMKGLEEGKTHYEIEGKKNGKNAEVTFDPSGKRVE